MALRTNLLQVAAVRNSISSNDEILGFASDYTTEIRFTFATLKSAILGGSGTGAYLLKDGSEAMTGGLQVNPTWNSAPTIFSALKVNVTDTSSDSSSLLFDLQKDSAPIFQIVKSGQVKINNANALFQSSNVLTLGNSSNTSIQAWGDLSLTSFWNNGTTIFIGIDQQITNTASAADSKAYRLRVGGVEKISFQKSGDAYFSEKIGIGTTSPGASLDVKGGSESIRISDSTSGRYVEISQIDGRMILKSDPNGNVAASYISAEVDGLERLRITDTGNVGMGTVNPLNKLSLQDNGSTSPLAIINTTAGNAASPSYFGLVFKGYSFADKAAIRATDESSNFSRGQLVFLTQDNSGSLSEKMRITHAGSVGIGTQTPGSRLDIVDTTQAVNTWTSIADCIADASFRFKGSNNANGYGLFVGYASSSNNAQGIQAGNQVGNSSVPLVLNPFGGSLGINKLSPTSQLHLAGDFAIEEKVSAPSSLANNSIIYSIDNGSSQTNLMAQMPSGSAQKILGEPPALSGSEPGTVYLIGGENFGVDASKWFSGDVTHYAADLPRGVTINSLTGLISGSITYTPSETFTVRAYNGIGYLDYSFSFEVIKTLEQMQMQAKGWFDMTPTTRKTDLVANFSEASATRFYSTAIQPDWSGDLAVSFWLKVDALDGTLQWPVDTGGGGLSDNGISMRLQPNNTFQITWNANAGSVTNGPATGAITTANWYHVVYQRKNGNIQFFVDGVQIGSDVAVAGELGFTGGIGIGGFGLAHLLTGKMAMLAIMERGFDSLEIAALYNSGTPSLTAIESLDPTGRVSLWPMFEPRGPRYDIWGSNHLTAVNNPTAAHGPVEYQAREYAGVTKWINQGLASGKFGNLTPITANTAPQLLPSGLTWDGVSSSALASATGSLSPGATIIVRARNSESDTSSAGLVDSKDVSNRYLLYVVGGVLRAFTNSNGLLTTGETMHTEQTVIFRIFDDKTQVTHGGTTAELPLAVTNAMNGLAIGSYYTQGTTDSWDGIITDVLAFDTLLTAAEEAALTQYLSA